MNVRARSKIRDNLILPSYFKDEIISKQNQAEMLVLAPFKYTKILLNILRYKG